MCSFSPFLAYDALCHQVARPALPFTSIGHRNHSGARVELSVLEVPFHPLAFSSSPICPYEFLQLARFAIRLLISFVHLRPSSC